MTKTKQVLSVLLSLLLMLSTLPIPALAVGTEPTEDARICICDTLCTEGNGNADCPVCGAEGCDLTQCTGISEPNAESPEDTQICICDAVCAEGSVNGDCPVCGAEGADLAQCTGTSEPEAEGSETGDAPEQPDSENKIDQDVADVQAQIDALPTVDILAAMSLEKQQTAYEQVQAAYDAYNALTDAQKEQIIGTDIFDGLFAVFNSMTNVAADDTEEAALTGDGTQGSPYQIGNADELFAFARIVNEENPGAWGELTADIDLNPGIIFSENGAPDGTTPKAWMPIGEAQYTGTFDGNGNTVSGIYIYDSSANPQGLFGGIGTDGKVQNLGVENSYISAGGCVGGVAGENDGAVSNCYNTGTVYGSGQGVCVGGVVGQNDGTVSNCYNTGMVTGSGDASFAGGVAGMNSDNGTVQCCCNTGMVNGRENTLAGGVVGSNASALTSCYYLENTASAGIGGGNGSVASLTAEQMSSSAAQTNMSGFDFTDTWGIKANTSSRADGDTYSTATTVSYYPYLRVFGEDSAPAAVTSVSEQMKTERIDGRTFYLIYNADQLITFGNIVNGTLTEEERAAGYTASTGASGKLMADIDLNPGFTFHSDGTYSGPEGAEPDAWNTMGRSESRGVYSGTFDGNGYAVSGVYINANAGCQGLFGSISGTVRNVRVENSYISSGNGNSAGGVVAINWQGTVENCVFTGSVRGNERVGGIVGRNRRGTIRNCYNTGTMRANKNGNGIAGNNESTVENCFTTTGAVTDNNGTINNCYFISNNSSADGALTAEEMTGPNAVATMNLDSSVWTAGSEPQWEKIEMGEMGQVHVLCRYLPQLSIFVDKQGFDQVPIDSEMLIQTDPEDGKAYYLIYNAAQLNTFRNIINDTLTAEEALFYAPDASANGKLMADIVLNDDFDQSKFGLDENGNVTYGGSTDIPFQQWTPIGDYDEARVKYAGTFNGNSKTVSGIYINDSSAYYQGLFGCVDENGKVKSLGVKNSYIFADDYVGGVVGESYGTIQNSYNTGTVTGGQGADVGGVVGENDGTVQNSYNTGTVSAGYSEADVGGVAGKNDGTVQNSYNTGTVSASASGADAGGVVGKNDGTVQNSYNTGTVSASGESAYAGGVVGRNNEIVQNSYNTGTVSARGIVANVGGVVGENDGTVQNSYNTGTVSARGESAYAGGVVGRNNEIVQNSYNTGTVTGSQGVYIVVGGVAGENDGTVQNSYYLEGTAAAGIGGGSSGSATSLTVAQIEDAGENGLLAMLAKDSEEDTWDIALSAVGTWGYGKPAVQPILSWQTPIQNAPTYTVTIPETAAVGGDAVTVSADAGALRADQTVVVAVDADNSFALTNGGTGTAEYQILVGDSTTAVKAEEAVLTIGNTNRTAQVSIYFALSGTPVYAGTYTGTCTFAVSVKQNALE